MSLAMRFSNPRSAKEEIKGKTNKYIPGCENVALKCTGLVGVEPTQRYVSTNNYNYLMCFYASATFHQSN